MPTPKPPAFETLSLHAGQRPDPATGARAVPIYQTTSYVFEDSDHAAALFNLERAGHIYTRISNPTTAVLEERIAALEAGVGAIATASGMAAIHLAIATLLNAGDHIVASASLYGGTINLLAHTLPRFGITTTFVKPRALDEFRAAIRPTTRLVIGETIGNPGLKVLDIPRVAQIAHEAKIPLLIDNTFATPFLSRPIELGADIVMNSATKWLGGHGIAIGGVIVDGGRFDWHASGKFPVLTEPYAGYHGIVFDEQFGQAAFIMRARTEGLRDFGACLSPMNAFQLLQGIETLGVRMERHVSNTHSVLEFLTVNKAVDWVLHPALETHPDYALAKKLLPRGDPPGQHHASADGCGSASGGRHRRGIGAAVRRHRGGGRYHRRSRPGAAGVAEGLSHAAFRERDRYVCGDRRQAVRSVAASRGLAARRWIRSFNLGAA
jgi:O-acetylhomoserine (thiol)-lyase